MIRVLFYVVLLAIVAYGGMWLVEHPGTVTMTWLGEEVKAPAALLVIAIALIAIILWVILRTVLGLPSFLRVTARQRRREKGYAALSRGLVAVGAGDARTAGRASAQAGRHLRNDPLAMMLRAQAAHLNGDEHETQAAFEELAKREDTRILGLRGLFAEASRRGDDDAARHFAAAAHDAAPLPWSAQAVLEHRRLAVRLGEGAGHRRDEPVERPHRSPDRRTPARRARNRRRLRQGGDRTGHGAQDGALCHETRA